MKFNYSLNHNEVFVIAEAGSNWKVGTHDQDILRAQELIEAAAIAGADAIKFQTYNAASVYSENAGKSDYLSKQGTRYFPKSYFRSDCESAFRISKIFSKTL